MVRLEHRPFSPIEETLCKAVRLVDEETGIIRLLHEAPVPPDSPKIFGCGSLCSDFGKMGYPADNPISGSTSLIRDQAIVGAIGEAVGDIPQLSYLTIRSPSTHIRRSRLTRSLLGN